MFVKESDIISEKLSCEEQSSMANEKINEDNKKNLR